MTSESGRNDNQDQSWGPCPPGEICKLNSQLRSQVAHSDRNRRMLIMTVALFLFTPAALWSIHLFYDVKELGGLTCEQVEAHYPGYANHELDQSVTDQIEIHLNNCPKCREHYQELQKQDQDAVSLNHLLSPEHHGSSEIAYHIDSELRDEN